MADQQHGEAADLYEMLAVLGEEFGELQQAALQFDHEGGRRDHILKECIQVGAMACKTFRFITENVTTPRCEFQCPTCTRSRDERGRHEPLRGARGYHGDQMAEESPWCPDPFHA